MKDKFTNNTWTSFIKFEDGIEMGLHFVWMEVYHCYMYMKERKYKWLGWLGLNILPWKGRAIRDLCRIKFDESMPATPRGPPTSAFFVIFLGIKRVSTKHKWRVHGQDSHCRRVTSISDPLSSAVIISCLVCKKHILQSNPGIALINDDIHVHGVQCTFYIKWEYYMYKYMNIKIIDTGTCTKMYM